MRKLNHIIFVCRLKHDARIQYTLFLKEIGMPLKECLEFWKEEYSKIENSADDGSRCGHSWQKNGVKYQKSIESLYGYVGSKIDYSGHCCKTLQRNVSGFGGCPFVNDNDKDLKQYFNALNVGSISCVKASTACKNCLLGRLKNIEVVKCDGKENSNRIVEIEKIVSTAVVLKPSHFYMCCQNVKEKVSLW